MSPPRLLLTAAAQRRRTTRRATTVTATSTPITTTTQIHSGPIAQLLRLVAACGAGSCHTGLARLDRRPTAARGRR
jgi:hypothetical protein